jgi:hypothetical protein
MSLHTNYQPAKRGLIDAQIMAAKQLRMMKATRPVVTVEEVIATIEARKQRKGLRYSDQGDFTRCYRGGF